MLKHKTRLVCAKGGLLSEKSGGFLLLPTLQKIFRFTILNYYIQYVALTMNAWKRKLEVSSIFAI